MLTETALALLLVEKYNSTALFGDILVKPHDVACWLQNQISIGKGDPRTSAPELSAFCARDYFNKLEEGDENFYS